MMRAAERSFEARAIQLLIATVLFGVALACGQGTITFDPGQDTLENVRILDLPQYICPSSTPLPTHTPNPTATSLATSTQAIVQTPETWATFPTSCLWTSTAQYRFVCPPNPCLPSLLTCGYAYVRATTTPVPPGGRWVGGGVGLGATSTPPPTYTPPSTYTPYPTPTPYVVTGDYAMGADVYLNGVESPLQLRLRVANPHLYLTPTTPDRQIVSWDIEIENIGILNYNAWPWAQTFVREIHSVNLSQTGYWSASLEAAQPILSSPLATNVPFMNVVRPGQTLTMTLYAFTPPGELWSIGWVLDPTVGTVPNDDVIAGGNVAYWLNRVDPYSCIGNIAAGAPIPTLTTPHPSPTPSRTPAATPVPTARRVPRPGAGR